MTPEQRKRLSENAAGVETPPTPPTGGVSPARPRNTVDQMADRIRRREEELRAEAEAERAAKEAREQPGAAGSYLDHLVKVGEAVEAERERKAQPGAAGSYFDKLERASEKAAADRRWEAHAKAREEGAWRKSPSFNPIPAQSGLPSAPELQAPGPERIKADDSKRRENTSLDRGRSPYGPYHFNEDVETGKLALKYADEMAAKKYGKGMGMLEADQQRAIFAEATDRAKRDIAAITKRNEQRGNMTAMLDDDPQKITDEALKGQTWLRWWTGQGFLRNVESAVGADIPLLDDLDEVLAPFHAMARPGVSDAHTAKPQREQPWWWAFRLAPSTYGGAMLNAYLDPDRPPDESMSEHAARQIVEGYDFTQDWKKTGERVGYLVDTIPGVSQTMEIVLPVLGNLPEEERNKVLGVMATAAVVLAEPDVTLGLIPVAKLAARGLGAVDVAGVALKPGEEALKKMRGLLESGTAIHELPRQFARGTIERRVAEYIVSMTVGTAAEDGLRSAAKMGVNASRIDELLAKLAAGEQKAAKVAEGAARVAEETGKQAGQAARATDMADAVQQARVLAEREKLLSDLLVNAFDGDDILKALNGLGPTIKSMDDAKRALKQVEQQLAAAARLLGDDPALAAKVRNLKETRSALMELLSRSARVAPARAVLQQIESTRGVLRSMVAAAKAMGAPDKVIRSALNDGDEAVQFVNQVLDGANFAADKANRAADRAKRMNEALADLRKQREIAEGMKDRALDQIGKMEKSVQTFRNMARADRKARLFDTAQSAFRLLPDMAAFKAAARAKYGARADDLIRLAEEGVSGKQLRQAEEAAFMAAEGDRLRPIGGAQAVLDQQVRGGALASYATLRPAGLAVNALRAFTAYQRVFEPVRGMARLPRAFQESIRRHINRLETNGIEVDGLVKGKTDEEASSALIDYLFSNKLMHGVESVLVGNQDSMALSEKCLEYLRSLAAGDPQRFGDDRVVQALARAWMPQGKTEAVGLATDALFKFVTSGKGGSEFLDFFQGDAARPFLLAYSETERGNRAMMFFTQAILTGASQYDLLFDWTRYTSGLGLGKDAIAAFDFLAEPSAFKINALRNAENNLESVQNAMALMGEPLVKTALFLGKDSQRAQGIIRFAMANGDPAYLPASVYDAVQAIPRRLEKELQQFHGSDAGMGAVVWDKMMSYLGMWRLSAIHGWFVPRASYFSSTEVGDWSQMAQGVGFAKATQLAMQNIPNQIPFVGRKMQDVMSDAAGRNSMTSAFMNPQIGAILRGDPNVVVQTAEGPVSGIEFLREAVEHGVRDAISTGDLHQFGQRMAGSSSALGKLADMFGVNVLDPKPSAWVRASAEMFEAVQYRKRLNFYWQARTGGLTGTPMPAQQARDMLAEVLYDFRTGAGQVELSWIGRVSAFWVYRRNMWRQTAAALTEVFTTPGLEYAGRALTSNTKIGRTMKGGKMQMLASDVYAFGDDDDYVVEAERLDAIGKAHFPWWADAQMIIGNKALPIGSSRRTWYNEVLGRDAPFESLIFSGVVWYDQMYWMNLMAQTGAWTINNMALASGAKSNLTPVTASEVGDRWIEAISDTFVPGMAIVAEGVMRELSGIEGKKGRDGYPVETAWQVLFQRAPNLAESMGAQRDARGRWRMPNTTRAFIGKLAQNIPPLQNAARTWAVFDNPSWNESMVEWLNESAWRWASPGKLYPHDPYEAIIKENEAKAREIKELQSTQNRRMGR